MNETKQYSCPSCSGKISIRFGEQKVKCPFCGNEFDSDLLEDYNNILEQSANNEFEFDTSTAGKNWPEEDAAKLRTYICGSCGGEIITNDTTAATNCPYCGSAVVMNSNLQGNLMPDLIIPFKKNKQDAIKAYHEHLKSKPMVPKMFKDESHIEEIKGIYIPFWIYDADVDVTATFRVERTHHWSDRDYNYTDTEHYLAYRAGQIAFENVPVDGSSHADDALMESLEAYDMSEAVEFQTGYLAGYMADKYDLNSNRCAPRAYVRIKESAVDALRDTVYGFETTIPESAHMELAEENVKYCLLPVWILVTQYQGEKYTFAMNGQTGKFVGNLPVDNGAFVTTFIKIFIGCFIIISLLMYVLFWR